MLPPPRASGPALPAATARPVGPELHRPHLHLRHLVAVVVAFPRLPVDAVCKGLVGPPEVETIEVRQVTLKVPPAPLVALRAVFRI